MASVKASPHSSGSVLEFYSGTGGMHYALMEALGDRVKVVAAFDINTSVNSIYRHNFPKVKLARSWLARLRYGC